MAGYVAGLITLTAGAWLLDSAIANRNPVTSLIDIIRNPDAARETLAASRGTGFIVPSVSPSVSTPGTGSGGTPALSTGSTGSSAAATAIAFARSKIGNMYLWGGTGPNRYDCSGLTQASFRAAGIKLPRTTAQQIFSGTGVSRDQLIPGDLVFANPGHVAIYTGNNMIVEAPRTGLPIREVKMWGFWRARRVIGGTAGSANAAEAPR